MFSCKPQPLRALVRFNSHKVNLPKPRLFLHRADKAGLATPHDAADLASTILADNMRFMPPNKALWLDALRERRRQLAQGKVIDLYVYSTPKTTEVGDRTREDLFLFLTLPFKDNAMLCDNYVNANGRLRVGQLFQDLDALAGRILYRHCAPAEPMNVTASVDRILMVKRLEELSRYNFVLAGAVVWTGRLSMEISVKGFAFEGEVPKEILEATLPKENVFLSANFTFVARNPETHKAFPINRLLPTTELQWIDYRRAELHNAQKKLAAKTQLLTNTAPTPQELVMIHNMWAALEKLALKGVLAKNSHLLLVFTADSKILLTLFMQPQYRNRHLYMIFGGYLLRQTFELAFSALAAFARAPPRFVLLDSTHFAAPVPVGTVLFMDALVVYTEHIHDPLVLTLTQERLGSDYAEPALWKAFDLPSANLFSNDKSKLISSAGTLIQVKVDTLIRKLEDRERTPAGSFIYSFFVPTQVTTSAAIEGTADATPDIVASPGYCSVVPATYLEMMDYVDGRRRAEATAAAFQHV